MIEAIQTFSESLVANLRLADVIDIGLVAAFLYILISWLRRSTSRGAARRLVVVLTAYAVIYLSARSFELYMVGRVAEVLFFVFVLVMVVVFQSDLRRMLDRTGTWLFSGRSKVGASVPIDQLTEAVTHMAKEKTGALIAIRGNEPWDRHIQGGIELGGFLSPPLLYGIFDHRTPGHDGALLMEGECIVSFAAHLPLSDNVPEVSKYGGTRHSAALGLSERCDAFVIVVSEERGTISVAENGTIEEMDAPGALRDRLERFWTRVYGEKTRITSGWNVTQSLQTATASLALAVTLWLIFAYSPGTVYRSFELPIEYRNVPAAWVLQDGEQWANVTISGPEQAFRLINPEQLSIGVEIDEPQEGWNEFTIDRGDINLPEQLSIETVQPQTIRVHARPMQPARLPVFVPTEGELSGLLRLTGLRVEPDSVTVLVPEDGHPADEISTEPVDLSEVTGDMTLRRELILANDMRFPPDADTEVEVHIDVERAEQAGQ